MAKENETDGRKKNSSQVSRKSKSTKTVKTERKAEKASKDVLAPVPPELAGEKRLTNLPIVGIGASAGGLEAFELFFTNMPPDSGMAFVLVQHLDPTHKSILTDLVKRYTRMPAYEIQDGMVVQPNTVFVIPPNRYLAILHGKLHLLEPTKLPGQRTPIDHFFRSLAEDQKERSICVILSGTGTEGTLGLRAVKGEAGMAMVQEPQTAKYDGMPRSAISSGLADYVLPPERMPQQLIAYVQHAFGDRQVPHQATPETTDLLEKVFIIVRSRTGHDFSYYKRSTIVRRIERRMALNQITRMEDYVRCLNTDPQEPETLFKELLIGVTNFFRDPEAWKVLQEKAIVPIIEAAQRDRPLRIWVPGCATGEEGYSIGILLKETMEQMKTEIPVQIFATDIDCDAVEFARAGIYPDSITADVSQERLKRFFSSEDSSHRVNREIRDMMVFAVQDAVTDPPFSRLNLVSCRNLLIYLDSQLQKKLLPLFHYALNKDGFLFLGSSETIGEAGDLFAVTDRKWKLYKRKDNLLSGGHAIEIPVSPPADQRPGTNVPQNMQAFGRPNYKDFAQKSILERYGPTALIVNEKAQILYVQGRTGKFLEHVSGEFSAGVLDMARQGLKLELSTAIRKAVAHRQEVRTDRLVVKTNGGSQTINLVVTPIQEPASLRGLMLVVLEETEAERLRPERGTQVGLGDEEDHPRVRDLKNELRSTKEYLQTTIEELETTNEELKSTNEELQSSNEELQSSNEELETSKEELQSVNEELTTVNSELQQKIDQLSKSTSDMSNLLASTEIGTVFLDTNLNIQRFTPSVTDFLHLIKTDIGRPVSHIASCTDYEALSEDAREVLETLNTKEMEVRTHDGRHFTMRILPYRTIENVIDGVVVTFSDITTLKRVEREALNARLHAESIVEAVPIPLIVTDQDLNVEAANRSFYETFQVSRQDTEGRSVYKLGNGRWNIPELKEILDRLLSETSTEDTCEVVQEFEQVGKRRMIFHARALKTETFASGKILLAVEDATGHQDIEG